MHPWLAGESTEIFGDAGDLAAWNADALTAIGQPLRWWRSTFKRPAGDGPLALDLAGMNKGMIWLNGRCVSRYWLAPGVADTQFDYVAEGTTDHFIGEPTQRYYHIPKEWLADENNLVLFEEIGGDPRTIRLVKAEDAGTR
jgi:hypothetical protein